VALPSANWYSTDVGLSQDLGVVRYPAPTPESWRVQPGILLWITLAYMGLFSFALVAWPDAFIAVFDPGKEDSDFHSVSELTRTLLYFVAAYSLLDGMNIVFCSALKGAGDMRFVFLTAFCAALMFLVVPVYVACVLMGAGIYTAWVFLSLWVVALAILYWLRFLGGKWRSMRVIEHFPAPATPIQEGPIVEA
jgi:MATE family multidrug resistance protein